MLPLLTEDREQVFVSAVSRSLLMGVLVGGGVAVALALAFARGILRPIGALTHAARKLEQGDLGQRVSVHSKDEIGQLAHAFNAMADGLARNERLRHIMVTDVAHELRTPLTNLRGYLEALRDGVTPISPRVVDSLYEEAMLLSHLVDDLQDLTLSEAGRLRLQRDTLDVREVLESAAQGVAQRAAEVGVHVSVAAAAGLVVSADRQRIGQVLRNLLSNAVTHTPAGGRIELRAEAQADGVRIEVSDTGCGIPPEHVPYVFERFYRADPSRARATGGAGIGLAVVRQLVEAHGAKVELSSVPGEGSVFSFTLPYRAPGQGANALVTPRSALLSAG
jgi:signal transduction histidine kinase